MAVEYGGFSSQKISVPAGADLSAKQYLFVKWDGTNNTVIPCSGVTDVPLGVLQNSPVSGGLAEVVMMGPTKVVASGNLTTNGLIGTDAAGKAVNYANDGSGGADNYVVGNLIGAAGADGVIASAIINCIAPHRGA